MSMQLKPLALGLAVGIVWAVGMFLFGLAAMVQPSFITTVSAIGNFYIGYDATVIGAFIGGFWAFLDGFIGGFFVGWLYNRFVR